MQKGCDQCHATMIIMASFVGFLSRKQLFKKEEVNDMLAEMLERSKDDRKHPEIMKWVKYFQKIVA